MRQLSARNLQRNWCARRRTMDRAMSGCAAEVTYEPPRAHELALRPCVRFDAELRGAWLADANPERRVFLAQHPPMLTRSSRDVQYSTTSVLYFRYGLRVPASCVLYVPEAQGTLPRGATNCTFAVRVPSLGPAARTAYRGTTGAR
eukprot:scaffold29131_cov50-Phaeocystis_antarctica.AAC.4